MVITARIIVRTVIIAFSAVAASAIVKLRSVSVNYYLSIRLAARRTARHALYLRNAAMNYPALIGVHRFKRYLSALLYYLCRGLFRKSYERLAALFAIAVAIKRYPAKTFLRTVARKYRQIL